MLIANLAFEPLRSKYHCSRSMFLKSVRIEIKHVYILQDVLASYASLPNEDSTRYFGSRFSLYRITTTLISMVSDLYLISEWWKKSVFKRYKYHGFYVLHNLQVSKAFK